MSWLVRLGLMLAGVAFATPAFANHPVDLVRAAMACAIGLRSDRIDVRRLEQYGWEQRASEAYVGDYAVGLNLLPYARQGVTAAVLAGVSDGQPACVAIQQMPEEVSGTDYAQVIERALQPERISRDGDDILMLKLGRIFILNLPNDNEERVAVIRVVSRN